LTQPKTANAANSQADAASGAGNPANFTWNYRGPSINATGSPTVSNHDALAQIFAWFDSVGGILPEETALAQQLGANVDVGLFPYTPHPIAETQLGYTFQHIALFKPKLYLPTHHDHIWGAWLDNGLQPLFMKIRDEQPATQFAAPLYRSAICIATSGVDKGKFIVKN